MRFAIVVVIADGGCGGRCAGTCGGGRCAGTCGAECLNYITNAQLWGDCVIECIYVTSHTSHSSHITSNHGVKVKHGRE